MYKDDPIANGWLILVDIYKKTRDYTPDATASEFINTVGLETAIQVVSAIAGLKRHDGRIYGENRNWTDSNIMKYMLPMYTEYEHANPLLSAGHLDDIHTAHINQIITCIRNHAIQDAPKPSEVKTDVEKLWSLFNNYADTLQSEDWDECEIQMQKIIDKLDIMDNTKLPVTA